MTSFESIVSCSEEETFSFGYEFAAGLHGGSVVSFDGELGAGKTVFIRGICDRLCPGIWVSSPSFTLVNTYPGRGCHINHIDLYRIDTGREIMELGIDEYFNEDDITLIEWGEKIKSLLPDKKIMITIYILSLNSRRIDIRR
jgi:tRNA threonylcarbamoyladenosine biosynthesis protein TsaE